MRTLLVERRAQVALMAASLIGSSACLSDPELPACIDFPIGTEGCDSGCDVYCDEVIERCPGAFSSRGECITDCLGEPVNPSMIDGEFGDRESNTLSCRLTFLREGQCQNVGLLDSPTCVGASCTTYCELMEANCSGAYPSVDVCEKNCDLFPVRRLDAPDADDNTVDCRFKYANLAASDPGGPACDAASLNGGGVCGDNPCAPYCALVMRNCTDENAVYASVAECLRVCSFMNGDGRFDDWDFQTEGDSVQCRSYHAGPPAAEAPTTHCNHTRVYNIEHCGVAPGGPEQQPADWPCLTFCDIVQRECPGTFPGPVACRAACNATIGDEAFDPDVGPELFPVSTGMCPTL